MVMSAGWETDGGLRALFESGDRLESLYQPILSIQTDEAPLRGLECLTRGPRCTRFARAEVLFTAARRAGIESVADRTCIMAGLARAPRQADEYDLFVNVHPRTLREDRQFPGFLREVAAEQGVPAERVVVEVLEHGREANVDALVSALCVLEAEGAQVAFDDFGVAAADPLLLRRFPPRYVKIEGGLVRAASCSDSARRRFDQMVWSARRHGANTIAEGVESADDLAVAREAGVDFAQGYYLAHPLPPDSVGESRPGLDQNRACRILVLDDEGAVGASVFRALENTGYDLAASRSGVTGVHAALELRPDLIVVALGHGVPNGLDTCRVLRARRELCHTPVVIVLPRSEAGLADAARVAGCNDFVLQPVAPNCLRAVVNQWTCGNEKVA